MRRWPARVYKVRDTVGINVCFTACGRRVSQVLITRLSSLAVFHGWELKARLIRGSAPLGCLYLTLRCMCGIRFDYRLLTSNTLFYFLRWCCLFLFGLCVLIVSFGFICLFFGVASRIAQWMVTQVSWSIALWNAMTDVLYPHRMTPAHLGDPLIFPVAPSSGCNFNLSNIFIYTCKTPDTSGSAILCVWW